uniref:Protein NTM1-like 9 n=1 Tax=Nicotiana tabacum TaxID=4097 RepID=A0A1S3X7M8_TOBAC
CSHITWFILVNIFLVQGAFVLCRLFKKNELKQDENVESSHLDEVQQLVSSPAVGKSPGNEISDAVAPSPIMESDSDKSNPPKISGGETHGTRLPIDSRGDSCTVDDTEDQMLDITSVPSDPELEKLLEIFCDTSPQPLDWKICSPLHAQLQVEFGSSYVHAPVINEMSHDQKDVQFQNGTNAFDINEFFNSVLDSSDELSYEDSGLELRTVQFASNTINTITRSPFKDSGLCSESKAQVTQEPVGTDLFEPKETALMREVNPVATTVEEVFATPYVSNDHSVANLDFLNNGYPGDAALSAGSGGMQVPNVLNVEDSSSYRTGSSDSGFGTGIKLRTRLKQNQPDDEQFGSGMQGTSHRRIRFQVKRRAGRAECDVPTDSDMGGENPEELLTVSESEKFSIEDSSTAGAAICGDKTQDTMCKEFKGYGRVAEDLSANAKDAYDFPVDEASKMAALSSFSSSFYISKALVAVSVIVVFLGFLGICFKLR